MKRVSILNEQSATKQANKTHGVLGFDLECSCFPFTIRCHNIFFIWSRCSYSYYLLNARTLCDLNLGGSYGYFLGLYDFIYTSFLYFWKTNFPYTHLSLLALTLLLPSLLYWSLNLTWRTLMKTSHLGLSTSKYLLFLQYRHDLYISVVIWIRKFPRVPMLECSIPI